jgi:signal transduction histidine kinase
MKMVDSHARVTESIENAIADLSLALVELDRLADNGPTIAWVAHAMNTYLSVNEATLDLLKQHVGENAGPDVARWLDGLEHLAAMMHHSIGRLLRTSSPAEFPLKLEYINVTVLMTRACDYYRASAGGRGLEIVCRTIGDVPLAWADRVGVAVVMDNLLSNAVAYSNPGGQIVVQVMSGPGGVVCSVLDNGPGLTPVQQAHVFDRGARKGGGASAEGTPISYGLIIAKEFVDRMGGRLWCDSEAGRGACFSFRLPYHASSGLRADHGQS